MSATDVETSLGVLQLLADALTVPMPLRDALDQITRMTCELMQTDQAALLLRDVEQEIFVVRSCVGVNPQRVRVGHPLRLPPRLQSILWRTQNQHQINYLDTDLPEVGFPILVTPILVKGERIGLLITGKARLGSNGFDRLHRRVYRLVAAFSSLLIENAKVYDYLRQNFALHSQELLEENRRDAVTRGEPEQLMVSSLTNPNKVVRLLAESFYKELVKAGFAPGHITMAAAHILHCITCSNPD